MGWARFCLVSLALLLGSGALAASTPTLELYTEEMLPFNMQVGDKVTGLSTQILAATFAAVKMPFEVRLVPWARAMSKAESGAKACVYSTAQIPDRLLRFKWVGPIAHDNLVVFSRPDNEFTASSLDDLRGLRTATTPGDAAESILRSHGVEVELTPTQGQILMLQRGRIDFWMTMESRGRLLGVANQFTMRRVMVVERTDFYLACNRAVPDAIIDQLNDALGRLRQDGTVERISASFLN